MTKRMIDADALLEWLQDSDNIELLESVPVASVDFIIEKINELATPVKD